MIRILLRQNYFHQLSCQKWKIQLQHLSTLSRGVTVIVIWEDRGQIKICFVTFPSAPRMNESGKLLPFLKVYCMRQRRFFALKCADGGFTWSEVLCEHFRALVLFIFLFLTFIDPNCDGFAAPLCSAHCCTAVFSVISRLSTESLMLISDFLGIIYQLQFSLCQSLHLLLEL